jgi:hypothetical protein
MLNSSVTGNTVDRCRSTMPWRSRRRRESPTDASRGIGEERSCPNLSIR